MSRSARIGLFVAGAAGLGALLAWGIAGLPAFGEFDGRYTEYLLRRAVDEVNAPNVVASVVFDYRAVDTLGEEFVLFASAMGVALLLREVRQERSAERPSDEERSDVVRAAGLVFVPPTIVVGVWVVAHGHLSPGGGFQGGVVLAAAAVLLYLAGGYRAYRAATPEHVIDAVEGVGAAGFAAVGVGALAAGAAFLENVLPPGRQGDLASAGQLPLLNALVALEVAAAFVLLFTELLEEVVTD